MATALELTNLALEELGVERVTSTSQAIKSAREVAAVYGQVLAECLANGHWNFATRVTQEDSDATPSVHDFTYQFTKPTDWVRTSKISGSNALYPPLTDYSDEAGKWYANIDPIYVAYVSNNASFGGAEANFPALYSKYVGVALASRVCITLTQDKALKRDIDDPINGRLVRALKNARSKDGSNQAPGVLPEGRIVRSRGTFRGSNMLYDRKVS